MENCLAELIRAGAELEIESPNSSTALMEAARSGHLYCAQLLVEAGAKLDAKDVSLASQAIFRALIKFIVKLR